MAIGDLAVGDIDQSRTETTSPQTNGIVERLHKTMLNEFYRIAFRKKPHTLIAELQDDLDEWIRSYNEERPHQGRWCFGKTPLQTFLRRHPHCEGKNDRCLTTVSSKLATSKNAPPVRSSTSYYRSKPGSSLTPV
jgi:hypothetical protein